MAPKCFQNWFQMVSKCLKNGKRKRKRKRKSRFQFSSSVQEVQSWSEKGSKFNLTVDWSEKGFKIQFNSGQCLEFLLNSPSRFFWRFLFYVFSTASCSCVHACSAMSFFHDVHRDSLHVSFSMRSFMSSLPGCVIHAAWSMISSAYCIVLSVRFHDFFSWLHVALVRVHTPWFRLRHAYSMILTHDFSCASHQCSTATHQCLCMPTISYHLSDFRGSCTTSHTLAGR